MLVLRSIANCTKQKDPLIRLLLKTPKTVEPDIGQGLLARIFEQSKKIINYYADLQPIFFSNNCLPTFNNPQS